MNPAGASGSTASLTSRQGPGRPRESGHDDRVIDAVLALIDEEVTVTIRAVVERSGVSRAAIYRRWPALTDLVAAALDRGRSAPAVAPRYATPEGLIDDLMAEARAFGPEASTGRVKSRLVMGLQDRDLQRAYWESHASRRRDPMRAAIEAGKRDGLFHSELDTEACCDALVAVFYYQVVVRGERDFASAAPRIEAALRTVLGGMVAGAFNGGRLHPPL